MGTNSENKGCGNKPMILCIVGPSGCGKTTVSMKLQRTFTKVKTICSFTTRPRREGELDGYDHHFVSNPRNKKIFPKENMIAYTVYGGYEYWVEKGSVQSGMLNVYVIDEAGVNDLFARHGSDYRIRICKIVASETDCKKWGGIVRTARDKDREELKKRPDYIVANDSSFADFFMRMCDVVVKLIDEL